VNDCSRDNTAEESIRAGARVVNLPLNLGIGGAVQTGYLYALQNNYDCVVQIDGDGQHDPQDLPKLLSIIESGEADMAIGSRFVEKTAYKPPLSRKMGILYFSRLVSLLTGQAVTDTTSGYRAVNKKIIRLFADYYPSDFPEVETIVYAASNRLKVKETSVNMKQRHAGKSSITPLKSAYYAIKVTSCLLFSRKGGGIR
ncbi:MAG: glycosyltransferase family 2 protein, partial [Clostridiales bacterium]|nr:glycosyltransferase family 2 protein [Clostridiales bacterium]